MADEPARFRIGNAPCSFGVDDVLLEQPGMPTPDEYLQHVASLGFHGTELGLPGYLGEPPEARRRLRMHGLQLAGGFISQPFRSSQWAQNGLQDLRRYLAWIRAILDEVPTGVVVVLCDQLDDQVRMARSTVVDRHPEAVVSDKEWATMISNIHRAAEEIAGAGFTATVHPHAGSAVETYAEIDRLATELDPAVLGLCLDTGHFRYGGMHPPDAVSAYGALIRHVHLKDCSEAVVAAIRESGGGFRRALQHGVFCELGMGDSGIADVMEALARQGYDGWIIVEQDVVLTEATTLEDLVGRQRANRAFLESIGVWPG